jgi:2-iminoacetate synthase
MSAGSFTNPGGYTKADTRLPESSETDSRQEASEQFDIADCRNPREVAEYISLLGYEPVWKDWDNALS